MQENAGGDAQDDVQVSADTLQDAAKQLRAAAAQMQQRRLLRTANLAPQRPDEAAMRKLDSSVKRNTALTKRLRQITEDAKDSLLQDVARTNQSRYVSEAVTAVVEGNLRSKDVAAAVQVCSALHQRYADFAGELMPALARALAPHVDDDKAASLRRRSMFKLLTELLLVGLHRDAAPLVSAVRSMATQDFSGMREHANAVLLLLGHFARSCKEEVLGVKHRDAALMPVEQSALQGGETTEDAARDYNEARTSYEAELEQRACFPAAVQEQLRTSLELLFDSACATLRQDHAAAMARDARNLGVLNSRGDLPEGMASAYEAKRAVFEGLQRSLVPLAELLGRPMPELTEPSAAGRSGEGGVTAIFVKETQQYKGPFEDEETRVFYETLPDLRGTIPGVLLGAAPPQAAAQQAAKDDAPQQDPEDAGALAADALLEGIAPPESLDGDDASETGSAQASEPGNAAQAGTANAEARAAMDDVVRQLQDCVTRDLCDKVAVAFCYANNKAARKRMVRALLESQRFNPQMLPFYCRVTATLNQVFPDIGAAVVKAQEEDFRRLRGTQRDATHPQRVLDMRMRNARFLGELVKFRLLPFGSFFLMLKKLLDEFSHHNIDVAATLVETAGRYLFLLPETHERMNNMAELMMRLREKRGLDARQSMLVEVAYLQCRPPERAMAPRRKRRSAEQEWMRFLVLQQLSKDQIKHVLRKLRRLPWEACEPYLVHVLLKASKGRYAHIPLVASLAANLSRYHPSLGVAFVDALLEQIRLGLESPEAGAYQRRVGHMKLLGEAYVFRLIDSRVVFDTLYLLLAAGYETPADAERLDPPTDYFRIRLVCTLLEACGRFFDRGAARRRLDRFLTQLQRYVLAKLALPLDVEYDLQDVLDRLRPGLRRFESFEEANEAVAAIEEAEARATAAGSSALGAIEEDDDAADSASEGRAASELRSEQGDDAGLDGAEDAPSSYGGQPDDDDMDEQVRVVRPAKEVEVDEEFEREFAALMAESGPTRPSAATIGKLGGAATLPAALAAADDGQRVAFKVMMKRGGREDRSRAVQLPATSAMAVNLKAKVEAEAVERAQIKRLTLRANMAQEESELAPLPQLRQTLLPVAEAPQGVPKAGQHRQAAPAARGRGRGRGQPPGRGQQAAPGAVSPQQRPPQRVGRRLEGWESQFE